MADNLLLTALRAQIREWIGETETPAHGDLESVIASLTSEFDVSEYRKEIAEAIISELKLCDVIPEVHREYRPIVYDGVLFLLSNLSWKRFIQLVVRQLLLGEEIPPEQRLIELARELPTLHKLGQIIARNRDVEFRFRKWLILLENDTSDADAQPFLKTILEETGNASIIVTGDKILAEASVAAVVPFKWQAPDTGECYDGVFKLLKPHVKEHLHEEMALLDALAHYYDKNREIYLLKDFRFIETFRNVKESIMKEIHLAGEQANLKEAHTFYSENPFTKIPDLYPFSTKNMTAMERIRGVKITDTTLSKEQKERLAKRLFITIVIQPLFSLNEVTIFHGDPHGGNIFAIPGKNGEPVIALLDWSLAGKLTRTGRSNILRLSLSVLTGDKEQIYQILAALSEDNLGDSSELSKRSRQCIYEFFNDDSNRMPGQLMKRTFLLVDSIAKEGINFPADLLLLRKSIFTLEGLLYELDQAFDMDRCMFTFLGQILSEEMPLRWFYLWFPLFDSAQHYKSQYSNMELLEIINKLAVMMFQRLSGLR